MRAEHCWRTRLFHVVAVPACPPATGTTWNCQQTWLVSIAFSEGRIAMNAEIFQVQLGRAVRVRLSKAQPNQREGGSWYPRGHLKHCVAETGRRWWGPWLLIGAYCRTDTSRQCHAGTLINSMHPSTCLVVPRLAAGAEVLAGRRCCLDQGFSSVRRDSRSDQCLGAI